MFARGQRPQGLADGDVTLVGADHETGVDEAAHLRAHCLGQLGQGMADAGDTDARPEVDERVSVNVDHDGT